MENTIYFYSIASQWGEFSNFARFSIFLDGKRWPTSEHYFQAQKFNEAGYREEIRQAKTPMIAAQLGRSRKYKLRKDWESIKDRVMYDAVYTKFTQHKNLKELLITTGNEKLVEHTANDNYWGDGGDGSGQNKLGHTLMQVRSDLINENL